ncbi:light harvesting complex protein [Tribonema minus]|uniref:Light harvesting complex protein n=1 Tax=Tribonema minus TaxID=303371 RepID=A0A835ZBC8_9STRA|nr:light harvesting complex protein [Tribonema minus]
MKAACFAALIGSAAAFVPSSFSGSALKAVSTSSAAMKMSADGLAGADTETNGVWDPLGLSNSGNLYKYRACELKHGRVAMLATLGALVQTFYTLPDPVFANGAKPQTAAAELFTTRPEALWQILLACGVVELLYLKQDPEKAPGDLGWGLYPSTEEELSTLQLKELKNGRLAMVAITGMFLQEKLTGQGPIEQIVAGHISPFGDGQGVF